MKNNIDKITGFALACGQVALNPRVYRRNRNNRLDNQSITEMAVFLRPQYERTVGCAGNTILRKGEYPRRSYTRLRTPGRHSSCNSQKYRSLIMSTPFIHPHYRLNQAKHKIEFLATLLQIATEGDRINLDHPGNANGLYNSLTGIADDIEAALSVLEAAEVAA